MCTCKKKSCNGCSSSSSSSINNSSVSSQVSFIQEELAKIQESTKFLTCGHPIFLIETQSDLEMFDFSTGLGFDCWDGFGICDGREYINNITKKKITSPNFTDRFIVHAGGSYVVGDTGGENSVSLTTAQLAGHSHGVTDAGHSHGVTDAGHDHSVQEDPHTHQVTAGSHSHNLQIDAGGLHSHSTGTVIIGDGNGGTNVTVRLGDAALGASMSQEGTHGHNGTALPSGGGPSTCSGEVTGVQVLTRTTGVSVNNNTSGITISNEGGGQAHENRPPYYAALFVIKL